MPCYIQIFARVFEKARTRYFITPTPEEEEQLEALLTKKLEEVSNKPIQTHQELKMELIRLQREDPQLFYLLEKWLMEQLRKLRQISSTTIRASREKEDKAKPKTKKKKRKASIYV